MHIGLSQTINVGIDESQGPSFTSVLIFGNLGNDVKMHQPTVILVSFPSALSEWCEPAVMQSGRTIICDCVVTIKTQPQLESSVYLIS